MSLSELLKSDPLGSMNFTGILDSIETKIWVIF